MANTSQGHFPDQNTGDDGYVSTSPVKAFPSNGFGLWDMAGNVWEWTSDWYRHDTYQNRAKTGEVSPNPKGPSVEDLIDEIISGVRSACTYAGARSLDEFAERAVLGIQTAAGFTEGTPHGL